MPKLIQNKRLEPKRSAVEALAREMVEDRWPYTYRWETTPKAERAFYLRYARMVLTASESISME